MRRDAAEYSGGKWASPVVDGFDSGWEDSYVKRSEYGAGVVRTQQDDVGRVRRAGSVENSIKKEADTGRMVFKEDGRDGFGRKRKLGSGEYWVDPNDPEIWLRIGSTG